MCTDSHWLVFIYKSLIGLVPSYLCICVNTCLETKINTVCDILQMLFPRVTIELDKKGFEICCPFFLEKSTKELITMGEFSQF